jgi:hypothetical protein
MHIPFEQLSDQASIWIYQAASLLSDEQVDAIMNKTKRFLEDWTSHGRTLKGGAMLYHHRFLVLGIEKPDYDLSCCTIDSAIHLLWEIKSTLQIDFLKRDQLCFKEEAHIFSVPTNQVKEKMQQGEITSDMLVFDNTIKYKGDLATKWLIPAKNSWLTNI